MKKNLYSLICTGSAFFHRILAGLAILLLLTSFGNSAFATGFTSDYVILNSTKYYTIRSGPGTDPQFTSNLNLGSYDRGTGILRLGAEANTAETGGDDVSSTQLLYRVYLQGTTPGSFLSPLVLTLDPATAGSPNKHWLNNTSNPNLLAATSGPGTYVLEVFFQGTNTVYSTGGGSTVTSIFDNNGGLNYTATFDVTGSVPVQWTGQFSEDWFDARNWSPNAVPTPTTDATIPYIAGASNPAITNGIAQVRTLRINGAVDGNGDAVTGARIYFKNGTLQVFGDFQDPNGGFAQTGGIFTLAGANQTFDGGTFRSVRVQGGGTKILTGQMSVINLTFVPSLGGGVITTRTDNPTQFRVDLGAFGALNGEDENNYVLGYVTALRFVDGGGAAPTRFGNIGIELSVSISAGFVNLRRLTGISLNGAGTSRSIKRSFSFQPDYFPPDPAFNFSLVFRYLDGELNGNVESNLELYRSLDSNVPFQPLLGSALNTTANTLTRNEITGTLAATFTLADRTNPLPVTVSSLKAALQGANALVTWTTAQELNNQGFEVQVSKDGVNYQELGFVGAKSPNSSAARSYQYVDVTPGKQGIRYYRLRQLDLDGKESFFGPRTVTFGEALMVSTVTGYPNPFTSEVTLTLQPTASGPASVRMLDGLGRQVRIWNPSVEAGNTRNLALTNLDELPRGIYVMQVSYSNGETQRLKLLKE